MKLMCGKLYKTYKIVNTWNVIFDKKKLNVALQALQLHE